MLNLDKLNFLICLTFNEEDTGSYEKHYIFTSEKGIDYFKEQLENSPINLTSYINPNILLMDIMKNMTYYLSTNEAVGFVCDQWKVYNVQSNKEHFINYLEKFNPQEATNLQNADNNTLYSILKETILSQFNNFFHKDNTFTAIMDKTSYEEMAYVNKASFINYLDRSELNKKLHSLDMVNSSNKPKIKI